MRPLTRVTIGVQARSTSKRFPNKVFQTIGDSPALNLVLNACHSSAHYMNRFADTKRILVNVAMCIPSGDPIKERCPELADIVEGSEDDVLSRYLEMRERFKSDYVVRITADCPLIPSFLITKHITCAVMNQYDYVSNVDEQCRTSADGMDCEVISSKALRYLSDHAKDPGDREHVTTYLRSNPPTWMKRGVIINFLDMSTQKLSLDTEEDLTHIRFQDSKVKAALSKAEEIYGKKNVHRF